jgi:2-dehydropantoate 2-reductase
MPPSILIQGIGAMGGVAAAKIIEAGCNPSLIAGSDKNASAITIRGLTLISKGERTHYPVAAFARVEDLPAGDPFDVVLILTKAGAVEAAARQALPRLHKGSIVLAMQNGIVEPTVAKVVGEDRVVASLCNWAATMHEPGVYEHTVHTLTVIGEHSGEITPRLRALKPILAHITPVQLSENILGAQWSKLAMNCTVTSLGAVAGSPLKAILTNQQGRAVFLSVYREVLSVAEAAGIHIEKLVLEPFVPIEGAPKDIEDWLDEAITVYGESKPSLLQDLERSKPTETDFIAGHVEQTAADLAVPAPLCAAINRMIHECERAERVWQIENIAELEELTKHSAPR